MMLRSCNAILRNGEKMYHQKVEERELENSRRVFEFVFELDYRIDDAFLLTSEDALIVSVNDVF